MKTETNSKATETSNHSAKCAAMNAHAPAWLHICRCATIAEADAAAAAIPRIRFVGPIGKGPEIHGKFYVATAPWRP